MAACAAVYVVHDRKNSKIAICNDIVTNILLYTYMFVGLFY